MEKIRAAVDAAPAGSGARQIGEVVLMIAEASAQAAEIIAADLETPEMSLEKCFDALKAYAKKHQQGGFWGCMCNRFDLGNEVIKVVCDFYKIPAAAFGEAPKTQAIPEPQRGEHASNRPQGGSWRVDGQEQKPPAQDAAPVVDLIDLL